MTADEIKAYADFHRCSADEAKRRLRRLPSELRERVIKAIATQSDPDCIELHDPIEDDPALAPLITRAERLAEVALSSDSRRGLHGFCHVFWDEKGSILRRDFGIVWFSPAAMNPDVMYD
jgi:hypothetical protein